jgi:hypothetical protein
MDRSAKEGDPFLHADQPSTNRGGWRGERAIIRDLEIKCILPITDKNGSWRTGSIFERVGQSLLHDPIGGDIDAWRQ